MNEVEFKGIVENLVQKFLRALNLPSLNALVRREVRKQYGLGLEDAEVQLNMNFGPNEDTIRALEDFTFSNIKGMNDEIAERLRKTLQAGLLNNEGVDSLRDRVKEVMNVADNRARLIARTEMVNARNTGSLEAAKQSGIPLKKQWSAAEDERTCTICGYLDGKVVELDEHFRDRQGNIYMKPAAHPNCRCTLVYVQQ